MYTPSYQTTTKPRGILRPPSPPPSPTSGSSSVSSMGSSTRSSRRVRFDRHDTTHPKTTSGHKMPRRSSHHKSQSQKGKRGPSVSTGRSAAPLHGKTPSKHYELRGPDERRRHRQQTAVPYGHYIRGHAPAYDGLYQHGYGHYRTHTQEMHRRHQLQQHYAQLSAMAVQQQMDQRRLRRHQQQQIYMYEQRLQQQHGRRHRRHAF